MDTVMEHVTSSLAFSLLSKHFIHARKINAGGENGRLLPTDDIFIPRIPTMMPKESDYPVLQFPVLVSYCLTINRASQGHTSFQLKEEQAILWLGIPNSDGLV